MPAGQRPIGYMQLGLWDTHEQRITISHELPQNRFLHVTGLHVMGCCADAMLSKSGCGSGKSTQQSRWTGLRGAHCDAQLCCLRVSCKPSWHGHIDTCKQSQGTILILGQACVPESVCVAGVSET